MKKLVAAFVWLCVLIVILESAFQNFLGGGADQDWLREQISEQDADEKTNKDRLSKSIQQQFATQIGEMRSIRSAENMSHKDLKQVIRRFVKGRHYYSYLWNDSEGDLIALSAMGLDGNHYFANSYLVGFVPFMTEQVWQPLAVLGMRKRYMFDHHLYGNEKIDVWQNSYQAFLQSHGDCEDHALLLADWLIGLGFDARVVVGEIANQGGHAWVILIADGREYVLEATTKRVPKNINDFMLASRAIDYLPHIQFNRTHLWENTGSVLTTNYRDNKWKLRARFSSRE
ncbi:MAG: transglutaminase-like domain-containing protein [Pseudomonadota bacterium]